MHIEQEKTKETETNIESKKPYDCPECERSFSHGQNLGDHMYSVHKPLENIFDCSLCESKFKFDFQCNHHMRTKHGFIDGKFICETCGFTTNTSLSLKKHVKMMHVKDFKCSFCESEFAREDQLEYHIEAKHPGTADLKYFCSECGDGFMFERNMVKHNEKHKKMKELLFIHEKEKVPNHGKKVDENEARKQLSNLDSNINDSLKSDFAGRNVNLENLSDELKKDQKMLEKFKSDFAGTNVNLENLSDELEKNGIMLEKLKSLKQKKLEDKKPRYCPPSNINDFSRKAQDIFKESLGTSKDRNKSNNRYNLCDHCGKGFAKSSLLKNHIEQVHSRKTCEHCGKSVLNGFYLKKHLVFFHGIKEEAFICDRCPKTIFSTEIALKKHVKEKHKNLE